MGRSIWRAGGALLLFLCIAVAGTAALTAQEIEVSLDTPHIIAGDSGGTINVIVHNSSAEIVERVSFVYLNAGSDPSGTLSVTSDLTSPYQTVFSSELAGDASIQIKVHYTNNSGVQVPVEKMYDAPVIPADPYKYLNITYATTVTVGDTTPIIVRMEDKFGNIINDKTGAAIDFWFLDNHIEQTFDDNGNCTVTLQAPTTAQTILIGIYPGYGKSLDRIISIDAISLRDPASIDSHIVTKAPDGTTTVSTICMADGATYFDVGYTVRDNFSNPIANYPVHFSTDKGATQTIITSDDGMAHTKVGPQKTLGTVTVTGEAGGYTKTDVLTFSGGSGQGYGLSVNPSDIPSYEVDSTVRAAIQARVFNAIGTGVANENVTFSIKSGSITNNTPLVNGPILEGVTTVPTDENGYATIYFRAGEFPDQNSPDFYHSAMGSCTVEATWNGDTKISPEITWRNYPYLRVETNVSDSVVAPGEAIDVTIHLIGDGNEFQDPGEISLVLCLDRGEDMLLNEGTRDRMEVAREASMILMTGAPGDASDNFNPEKSSVALITYCDPTTEDSMVFPYGTADLLTLPQNFGWPKDVGQDGNGNDDAQYVDDHYSGNNITVYDDYATRDYESSAETGGTEWTTLKDILWDVVPVKKDKSGQASAPLRLGLAKSIRYIEADPDSSDAEVKAVVLLMQNNYRYYGDPFAEGPKMIVDPDDNSLPKGGAAYWELTGDDLDGYDLPPEHQNMVEYAKDNGIKIYAIYYPSGGSVSDEEVPRRLAEETGGEYFFAGDEAALNIAFTQIHDALLRQAGLQTSVHLDFAEVPDSFNYTTTELLTYNPKTHIMFYNWTPSSTPYGVAEGDTPMINNWTDQTAIWLGTAPGSVAGTLEFEVGNISIKQTWMTEFQFTINATITEPLNFSLFGGGSKITFQNEDNSTLEQFLPPIMVTVIPGLAPETHYDATVDVYDLDFTDSDQSFAYFSWNINYTGTFPMDQEFYIRKMDGEDTSWKKIGSIPIPCTATGYDLSLFTGDLGTGLYEARTRVSTADAGYDEDTVLFGVGILGVDYYIRLS